MKPKICINVCKSYHSALDAEMKPYSMTLQAAGAVL